MRKFGHDSEELLMSFAINMIIITTIIIQIGESWKKIVSLDGEVHSTSSCIAIGEVDKQYLPVDHLCSLSNPRNKEDWKSRCSTSTFLE